MPNDNHQALGPEEIADIIKMQRREDAGKPTVQSTTRGVNLRARNFASPIRPIFEGKPVSEVMQRRNSDSTTMSQKIAELDSDEISLSSVQNMPTIPSVAESPGLFGMLATFSRFASAPKTNKANDDTTHRIGELPNRANLQQLAQAPVHMVDLQQNSGSLALPEGDNSHSSKGLSGLLHRRTSNSSRPSGTKSTFQSVKDGPNRSLDDDDFFAAMDGAHSSLPSTSEEGRRSSLNNATTATTTQDSTTYGETARERRKKRGNVSKPTATESKSEPLTSSSLLSSNSEVTSSADMLSSESLDDLGLLSKPSPDWTPIIPIGTKVPRPKITSTIDESEHSLSSIAAKRRPLAKETLLAQELARKQQEALAALLAQSAATLDLEEEMDESVDTSDPEERPTTNHDWQDVVEEAYTKQVSRPLALSADDDDDEETLDDDALGLRPKSREVQKIQGKVEKQEEQLRSIVQATPDAYQALLDAEIMTKKETKEVTRNRGDWHDVSEDTKKSQSKEKKRDFSEDEDSGEEMLPRPASRDARQLDDVARKQRRQVRSTMEATPDATSAIEPNKALSDKEKYATRKMNGQWHDVKVNSAQAMLKNAKESPTDEDDRNEGGRHKSRRMRSFEETTKKQKETVENLILDQVDPEEALHKVRGRDRKEQRDYRSGNDWHGVDVKKQKSYEEVNDSYPKRSIENPMERQHHIDSAETTDDKRTNDKSPPKGKSRSPSLPSKAKPHSKRQDFGPTSAYPVSDAPLEQEVDSSNNTLLVLQKKMPQFEGNQPISDPDETDVSVRQAKQEWYGVDREQHPLNSKGFYKQVSMDANQETTASGQGGNKSPTIEVAPLKRKDKSLSSSSKTKSESEIMDLSPTNAYPLSVKTSERDNDLSKNHPPASTTTPLQRGTDLPPNVTDETGPFENEAPQDWHGVGTAKHPGEQKGFYKSVDPVASSAEKSAKADDFEGTEGSSSKRKDKSSSSSSKTKSQSKRIDLPLTNAYPISDATSERDNDPSRNTPLVSTTTIPTGTFISRTVAEESEPSAREMPHDWHGVDTAKHPGEQKGFYKSVEPAASSTEKSATGDDSKETEGRSSKDRSRQKSTTARIVEDSARKRNRSSGKRTNSKSPKSRSKNSSKNQISDNEVTNVMWQRVSSHHSKKYEENQNEGKEAKQNREKSDDRTSGAAIPNHTNNEIVDRSDVEKQGHSVLSDVESVEGPFNKRPELNPFNHRPLNGNVLQHPGDLMKENTEQSHDKMMILLPQYMESEEIPDRGDAKKMLASASGRKSPGTKVDEQFDDKDSNRSSEESRRKLLRKKVDDRREALTSIFHHTHEVSLNAENEILDLKRKLALSQALVQRLEIENGELQRRALLEFSDAQLKLLKQRDNREKELEERIKTMMKERDAAVLECHDLRILVNGSCDYCRQRFDNHSEYFMDYSVRKTIISKRIGPEASAFQWFTAGLAEETQNASPEGAADTTKHQDLDPDNQEAQSSPAFPFVPFQWLSTKLVVNAVKGKQEDHATLSENKTENKVQDGGHLISSHDSTSYESAGASQQNPVDGLKASNFVLDGHSLPLGEVINEYKFEEGRDSRVLDNKDIVTPSSGSLSNSTVATNDPTQGAPIGNTNEDQSVNQFAEPTPLTPSKPAVKGVRKGKSFFSSLFGEKVDEDSEFAPGNGLGLKRFDSSSPKSRKLRVGLKDERVLDDMEILNSIMSISTHDAIKKDTEKRRFGLGDERFNDDERDRGILGAMTQSEGTSVTLPPIAEAKNNSITALRLEKFNDDNRDAKLLSLVKESGVAAPPLNLAPSNARASKASQRQTYMSEMTTLSSANLSPRKRVSSNVGGRGASKSGSYMGQFTNQTFKGHNKDFPGSPIPSPLSASSTGRFNDPKSGSPLIRDSRILAFHSVPIEVELEDERPWRSDSGLPRSSKTIVESAEVHVDPLNEGSHKVSQTSASMTREDEDLDQILALLAHEDA